LGTTVHIGEVAGLAAETAAILDFRPGRVGHACHLPSDTRATLLSAGIPLELCPTSNLYTLQLNNYAEHHFGAFWEAGHPLTLCADDTGVFRVSLSDEYMHILSAGFNGLSLKDLARLSQAAIDYIFDGEATKSLLRAIWERELQDQPIWTIAETPSRL
jgi:adenosine deaminase